MKRDERPYIFIDTCSLLDSCWNKTRAGEGAERLDYSKSKETMFWDVQFESLATMGDVIIPKRSYEELTKISRGSLKPDLASRAGYILQKIDALYRKDKIMIVGDENDPFADAILLSVALKFKTQKNTVFITQDRKLSEDLEAIRCFQSVDNRFGYDIKIRRVAKNGTLEPHRGLSKSYPAAKYPKDERSNESRACSNKMNWWEI